MNAPSRSRVTTAVTVLVATALLPALAVLVQLAQSPQWFRPHEDAISAFERRYTALRDALQGVAVVGYLAPTVSADPASQTGHLYMTRYTLAPIEVVDDTEEALVVADGLRAGSRVPAGLTVQREVGNGLLLLQHAGKPAP